MITKAIKSSLVEQMGWNRLTGLVKKNEEIKLVVKP